MALKPLGHRILIQPDEPAPVTDAGIVLPDDRDHVPVSGIVVAVGDGPERDARIRSASILRCMAIVEEIAETDDSKALTAAVDEMRRYRNHCERLADSIRVGDRVAYPVECGLKMSEDGNEYILLNEDDAVVIATEESEAA
jgi:co-chaperonin GroES (HSP10)